MLEKLGQHSGGKVAEIESSVLVFIVPPKYRDDLLLVGEEVVDREEGEQVFEVDVPGVGGIDRLKALFRGEIDLALDCLFQRLQL